MLKEIKEIEKLVSNVSNKDQEKVWISNFYSTRAGKLNLKYLKQDYILALDNLYDSINDNYASQISDLEKQISSATDALLKVDYQIEKNELELAQIDMKENFYDVYTEKTANTVRYHEFKAPSDRDYASIEKSYEKLYSEQVYQDWKDATDSLDKLNT